MKAIDEIAALLTNTWAQKTLEELRLQAVNEATGIAFDAVRTEEGQRMMIVLCVTGFDQIARLERAFSLEDDGVTEDWNSLTLADLAMRQMINGGGLRFESFRDQYDRRSAMMFVATEPDSVRIIETAFSMPK